MNVAGLRRWLAARRPLDHRRIQPAATGDAVESSSHSAENARRIPIQHSDGDGEPMRLPNHLVSGRLPMRWSARPGSSTTGGWATSATRSSTTSMPARPPRSIDELMAAETYICFGPDTLAEARNRGYHRCDRCEGVRADEADAADTWPGAIGSGQGRSMLAGHLAVPPGAIRSACPPSCCATASRPATAAAPVEPRSPSAARRPHRQRARLDRPFVHVPGRGRVGG